MSGTIKEIQLHQIFSNVAILTLGKINKFAQFAKYPYTKVLSHNSLKMPKEDCKYWDKCYQKNEQHKEKYNHPKNMDDLDMNDQEVDAKAPKRAHQKEAVKPNSDDEELEANSSPAKLTKDHELKGEADAVARSTENGQEFDTSALREEALGNIAGKNYLAIMQKRIQLATQREYDELLQSNEFIRHKFLVEMPPEFYAFWKFLHELRPNDTGSKVLDYIEKQFQLLLVGPFEFLAERFHKATMHEPGDYLRHWRFYYDPPEFQTVFVKKGTGVHYGYWRDTPSDKEQLLLARNDASKNCEFEFIAGNVFDAFRYYLEHDFASTPFTAGQVASTKKAMLKFIGTNENLKLEKLEVLSKQRNAKVVAKTFHRAGIVVPYVSKTQLGYRPLMVSDADLKKIIQLFEIAGDKPGKHAKSTDAEVPDDSIKNAVTEKLLPIATAASIALDECDFGTSLELGIDLFCSGRPELHELAQSLLVPAYTLLERPQFIAISKAHIEKRSKALNLSIFELDKNKDDRNS